ncbi:MAG: hypothetical protein WDW38_008906 [Sanguina aurantia]
MSKDAKSIEVLWDDQQHINSFNKLNARMHEIEAMIRVKKAVLTDYEDASNELMLSDEETVRYAVGECLIHMDKGEAEEKLNAESQGVEAEVRGFQSQVVDIKEQLNQLKAQLYGKFGKSINLEED